MLSPLLFNIYIDDVFRTLCSPVNTNQLVRTLAFTDVLGFSIIKGGPMRSSKHLPAGAPKITLDLKKANLVYSKFEFTKNRN